ncbi:MAG: type II toxin-antitoxin system VapC family toxin [Caldilineaceae bacterium]|nr:type II toxin-antitoxin system VapC family toxin [Caldilineaceae bacterium]
MSEENAVQVYFLDSSAIVKRYALEDGTGWVNGICDPTAGNIITISHIGLAEVAAALAAKRRAEALSTQDYEQTMADFISDAHRQYTAVIVDALLVDLAVDLTRKQKLRGCDAIQLASALTINTSLTLQQLPPLIFVAADSDLLAAASAEGLTVENPNAHV